ncbi:hypothetical protein QYE76_041660 [Lolium multiflorum]|uniref:60S ribosomal protein L6 n=1 Tax=Lolium multiflorum TaxID=4521 RepID=A0AAD8TFE2_LOLMU|nr:hypothetical protein QYE76_041660 [Lolium multiflorum]
MKGGEDSITFCKGSRFESTPTCGTNIPLGRKRISAYVPHDEDDVLDPSYDEKLQPSPDILTSKGPKYNDKELTPLDLFKETHCNKMKGLSPVVEDALSPSSPSAPPSGPLPPPFRSRPPPLPARTTTTVTRRSSYHRRGLFAIKAKNGGAFPKAAKPAAAAEPKFYPADDDKLRAVSTRKPKRTKLRSTITPGTVLILLARRYMGKRVVFLKPLKSGLLLITGKSLLPSALQLLSLIPCILAQ